MVNANNDMKGGEVKMGLTERHWFENEDVPENYEWALEDAVYNSRANKKPEYVADRKKLINELRFQLYSKEVTDKHYPVQLSASDATAILVLLKEQDLRVLSLEELQNADFAYIEDGNRNLPIVPVLITDVNVLNLHYLIEDRLNDNESYLPLECYGKTWRCWNIRPTDEQRKAAKWND